MKQIITKVVIVALMTLIAGKIFYLDNTILKDISVLETNDEKLYKAIIEYKTIAAKYGHEKESANVLNPYWELLNDEEIDEILPKYDDTNGDIMTEISNVLLSAGLKRIELDEEGNIDNDGHFDEVEDIKVTGAVASEVIGSRYIEISIELNFFIYYEDKFINLESVINAFYDSKRAFTINEVSVTSTEAITMSLVVYAKK